MSNLDIRDRITCEEFSRDTIVAAVADMTPEELLEFEAFLDSDDTKFFLETGNLSDEEIALIFGKDDDEDDLPF